MPSLSFQIESLDRKPTRTGGTYVVLHTDAIGGSEHCHHAHPDRTLHHAVTGDVIVLRRQRYCLVRVQRFRDTNDPWFESVPECRAWIANWERQNYEFHRRWWIEHTAPGGRIPHYYASATQSH